MIAWLRRRLVEWYHLRRGLGAPASKMVDGLCQEPHCRWPYHTHEWFNKSWRH